jgi:hypothetical protein
MRYYRNDGRTIHGPPFAPEGYMRLLTAVFLFLGILFVSLPSLAGIAGSAASSLGGSNVTPMNITPLDIAPMNLTPPDIVPAPSVNPAHIEHFQAALAAQQQAQQEAWEAQMIDRQKQADQTRLAADAKAAAAAAIIAPASGNETRPPYKPPIFLVGLVKLVNAFADHKDKTAAAP